MSVDILVLFINCFPELTESLSINSYISVSFSQFLKMYHVPLIGPHFLASSYVLYLCIRSHILKTKTKTATSPSTYGLRLYREKSSPVRPVRFCEPFKPFLWMCLFWTCKCKFQVRWICCLLFFRNYKYLSLASSGMSEVIQVLWSYLKPAGSLVFHVRRLLEYVRLHKQ